MLLILGPRGGGTSRPSPNFQKASGAGEVPWHKDISRSCPAEPQPHRGHSSSSICPHRQDRQDPGMWRYPFTFTEVQDPLCLASWVGDWPHRAASKKTPGHMV